MAGTRYWLVYSSALAVLASTSSAVAAKPPVEDGLAHAKRTDLNYTPLKVNDPAADHYQGSAPTVFQAGFSDNNQPVPTPTDNDIHADATNGERGVGTACAEGVRLSPSHVTLADRTTQRQLLLAVGQLHQHGTAQYIDLELLSDAFDLNLNIVPQAGIVSRSRRGNRLDGFYLDLDQRRLALRNEISALGADEVVTHDNKLFVSLDVLPDWFGLSVDRRTTPDADLNGTCSASGTAATQIDVMVGSTVGYLPREAIRKVGDLQLISLTHLSRIFGLNIDVLPEVSLAQRIRQDAPSEAFYLDIAEGSYFSSSAFGDLADTDVEVVSDDIFVEMGLISRLLSQPVEIGYFSSGHFSSGAGANLIPARNTGIASSDPSITTESENADRETEETAEPIFIELPVVFENRTFGSVPAMVTPDRLVAVSPTSLAGILDGVVDDNVLGEIASLGGNFASVETFSEIGVGLSLDFATLSVLVQAPGATTGPFQVDLTGDIESAFGNVSVAPAGFAAGLTSEIVVSQNFSNSTDPFVGASFDGFSNVGGRDGIYLSFGGNAVFESEARDSEFTRDRIVAFHDNLPNTYRASVGDLSTQLSTLAGSSDFWGASISRSYSELAPSRSVRPLGARSFVLDEASEVTVLVNGQQVSRFNAPAGAVDLSDIPLVGVSNDVVVMVEDRFGRRVLDRFSVATDISLLSSGLTEYFAGVGVQRDFLEPGFEYSGDYVLAGSFRRGMSETLTLGGYSQVSEEAQLAGVEAAFSTLGGIAGFQSVFSNSELNGEGYATSFSFRQDARLNNNLGRNFEFRAAYQSVDYVPSVATFDNDIEWDVSSGYRRDVTNQLSLNASIGWLTSYAQDNDVVAGTLGGTFRAGQTLFNVFGRYNQTLTGASEVGVFFSLSRRLGNRSNASITHDTLLDLTEIEARRFAPNRLGAISADGRVRHEGRETSFDGGVEYTANRWRGALEIDQQSNGLAFDGDTIGTMRFQSGIAFADGTTAIGRDPGNGFYIVRRHKSLEDAQINVSAGTIDDVRGRTGPLGPAVVSTLSSYRPETIQIQVEDAPIGYNIGEGRYVTIPGALSGFDIEVGSAAYRSVVFTFLLDGEPLALSTAIVRNVETNEMTSAFSNRAGRLLASELEPGQYVIEFGAGNFQHIFTVGEDDEVFRNAGTVELSQ